MRPVLQLEYGTAVVDISIVALERRGSGDSSLKIGLEKGRSDDDLSQLVTFLTQLFLFLQIPQALAE